MELSYILAALGLVCLVILFINKKKKQAKNQTPEVRPPASSVALPSAGATQPVPNPVAAPQPQGAFSESAVQAVSSPVSGAETTAEAPAPAPVNIDWQNQGTVNVSVEETNALSEYEIYKQFGYYEQAIEVLEKYLSTPEHATPELVFELSGLYLQTEQFDKYAETLSKHAGVFSSAQLQEAVLLGLELDPNNLELRVLAEQQAGMDAEAVSKHLGDDALGPVNVSEASAKSPSPGNAQAFDVTDPAADFSLDFSPQVSAPRFSAPKGAQAASPSGTHTQSKPLVSGYARTQGLTSEERLAVIGFMSPANAVKLLSKDADYAVAIKHYNHAIQQAERPAALLIDALVLDHKNNQINAFAEHLWRLNLVLGKYGRRIKERLLGWGFSLGKHPVFDALGAYPDEQKIKLIGQEFGYLGGGAANQHNKGKDLVVQGSWQERSDLTEAETVVQEAESLIMYGQLDEALDTLEKGMFKFPNDAGIYSMLFALYERSESNQRFLEFAIKAKTENLALPDEALLSMNRLMNKMA